jgi:hypothetical protein
VTDDGSEPSAEARTAASGGGSDPVGAESQDQPPHNRANRTARFAWGAVVVILVGVIALIVYALTGPPASPGVVQRVPTSGAVISALNQVPAAVFDSVGVTASLPLAVPTVVTRQPPLESAGKPEVLFVGADFCPFCAAERWPLIVALSRFGHFTTLHNVQSSQLSVFPGIQTFSFVGMSYSSKYVAFTGVELYSNSVDSNGAFTQIATLTPAQSALVDRYGTGARQGARTGTFPFVDIDNVMVTSTSGFSPGVLEGHTQSAIAGDLTQPQNPVGQVIVASANYLTAGICRTTDQQPASVCATDGARSAEHALGLG